MDVSGIAAVAIGRNEGARLTRCVDSLAREGIDRVVYVDSASTDGSAARMRERGVEVVELDPNTPLSAARARNEGFARVRALWPDAELVQFVDGDMEVVPGWIAAGAAAFSDTNVVAVIGWRRERHPERSIYNRICDVEWRVAGAGEQATFGGDVMFRAAALAAAGGYNAKVVAAEDNELALRLRAAGGHIVRVDREAVLHDADMQRASQWWTRATRCGHAYAQVSALHGHHDGEFSKELRRTWVLGAALPGAAIALTLPTLGLSWSALALYPVQAARVAYKTHQQGFSWTEAAAWGANCALSPIPQAVGALKFHLNQLQHRDPTIIEYKGPPADDDET